MDARTALDKLVRALGFVTNAPKDLQVAIHNARNVLQVPVDTLEPTPHERVVPLPQTPLASSVDRDRHNEAVLVTRGGAEAMRQLALLAIDVALECPVDRPSRPGYYTYVSRDTVREIRSVLEAAGIPWKQQKKELKL